MIHVTLHAIQRYQERVANVPAIEAVQALTSPAIQLAAQFGAQFVRLPTGHRVVLKDHTIVTVQPPEAYRRQVRRLGLSRFGKSNRREIEE